MKHLRYLNAVLTVLAVLLTANLYVQLTAPSGGAAAAAWPLIDTAHAQSDGKKGVGSQAARQAEMAESLKRLVQSVDNLSGKLDRPLPVQVQNFPAASGG